MAKWREIPIGDIKSVTLESGDTLPAAEFFGARGPLASNVTGMAVDIYKLSTADLAETIRQIAWPLGVQDDLRMALSNEAMGVFEEMGVDREKISDALEEIARRFAATGG